VSSDDESRLLQIKALLSEGVLGSHKLSEAHPDMLFATDALNLYARDESGAIIGFKISFSENSQEVLNLIFEFPHLRRLSFNLDQPVEIPASVSTLQDLEFAWITGDVKKLPEQIVGLKIPLLAHVFSPSDRSPNLPPIPKTAQEQKADSQLSKLIEAVTSVGKADADGHFNYDALPSETKQQLATAWSEVRCFLVDVSSLEDPPVEIAARGIDAIATYFRDREAGYLQLNEVKVLLVGHGSCGKTSLVKRLIGEAFDPHESQTHGINIRNLRLGSRKEPQIKANLWDFGGQEIMHATHQFFLSKRSFYVLVLDGRKEEDAEYWLQHIQSFGGDSPVMIALNKIDENPSFDLNRRFLTTKYPSIVGYQKISCATGTGIQDFKLAIRTQLSKATMLQTKWPKPWFKLKRRLERISSQYISMADYTQLCKNEGVNDKSSQEALVEFLHDLGTILHFKDLHLLDTHVLDPRWVTEGVYRILRSSTLLDLTN